MKQKETASQVPALLRALDILERIARTAAGLGYAQLRQTTSIPPASLARILALLAARGYISKSPGGGYKLGLRLYSMGAVAGQQMDLLAVAGPALDKLRDATQETVELGIPDGLEIVIAAKVESARSIRLSAQVGYRLSRLHASGLGKVMLAHLPPAALEEYFARADWTRATKTTLAGPAAVRRELRRIRACGYGFDDREIREDVRRFGAPVFGAERRLAAVLSLAGPAFRMPLEKQKAFGFAVKNAAAEISAQLGYRAFGQGESGS